MENEWINYEWTDGWIWDVSISSKKKSHLQIQLSPKIPVSDPDSCPVRFLVGSGISSRFSPRIKTNLELCLVLWSVHSYVFSILRYRFVYSPCLPSFMVSSSCRSRDGSLLSSSQSRRELGRERLCIVSGRILTKKRGWGLKHSS